jgi:hypothetical protein
VKKEAPLLAFLSQLRQDLGDTAFVVADHWESDACAVGIANPQNRRVLAYVSTCSQPEDRYYLSLELPGESDEATDYRLAGTWESIGYSELRERVADHLIRRSPLTGRLSGPA